MKYTLDTIPVLDAYKTGCECPVCKLKILCEDQYLDTMLASAYMEPEWRIRSNETGFCPRHFELMFNRRNRLGLALMTHTHMQEVIKSLEGILAGQDAQKGFFARRAKDDGNSTPAKIRARIDGCVICEQVDAALKRAGITKEQLSAVAFTRGPGLMGSLLVGVSFTKGFARSLGIPMIDVNHLQGHVMAHFIKEKPEDTTPPFPFICLLVSGGNSQIVKVNAYNDMEVLGQTIDDAAGEAIDKCSKVMGLGYPGGPIIDRLARQGNPQAYKFSEPHIPGLDYSFSGLKTSFLYSLRKWIQDDPDFIEHHKNDLAASLEFTIVDILMKKLRLAVKQTGIKHVAVAGGVSANNGLRNAFRDHAKRYGWTIYIPKFSYTTDNAAMIGITGYYKFLDKDFCSIDKPAFSKVTFK